MRRLLMLLPAAFSLITKRVARRPLTRRHLNRLFLTAEEAKAPQLTLDVDDRRAEHVKKIIWRGAPPPNATLRVGVLDGGAADCAAALDGQGRLMLELPAGLSEPATRPRLDVILALPAPLRLKRILPMLTSLGVDNLWLCGAQRTERSYFGAKFLEGLQRDAVPRAAGPGKLRDLLVEGAEQSGDSALPKVALAGSLRPALRAAAENDYALRLAAHPDRGEGFEALDDATGAMTEVPRARRLRELVEGADAGGRAVLCVGPDRGWEEPEELLALRRHGFDLVTLGPRTLRTDVALVSMVALVQDWLDS